MYLTANTNELDAKKLLRELLGEQSSEISVLVEQSGDFIQIQPNVYCCFSYRIGHYSTMQHVIQDKCDAADKVKIILPPSLKQLKNMLKNECKMMEDNFLEFSEYFNEDQKLIDESYLKKIDGLITNLVFFAEAMKKVRPELK